MSEELSESLWYTLDRQRKVGKLEARVRELEAENERLRAELEAEREQTEEAVERGNAWQQTVMLAANADRPWCR